ncbi:MAG: hypothetical protein LDL41_07340 [Coleofasciculus sp. S288]|nr:hypothetical protein [Coleofasciculus sp. S288]
MIIELELLAEEECLNVCSGVYELKEFWIQRHPLLPFYTLGLASPYDIPNDKQGYYNRVKHYNSILRDRFSWLYERLADRLSQHLKAPTCYPETLALPGFHIFLPHKAFEQSLGAIHCDKSYRLHWQPSAGIDFNNPISFTLPIALPKFGAGMNAWDLPYEEVKGLDHSEIEQQAINKKRSFHPYQVGKLVLHSGLMVHQIAPGNNLQPDDVRITLQGHGLSCWRTWQLHW